MSEGAGARADNSLLGHLNMAMMVNNGYVMEKDRMHVVRMHDDTIRKDKDAAEGQIKSPTVSSHVMIRCRVPGPQAGGCGSAEALQEMDSRPPVPWFPLLGSWKPLAVRL